MKYAIVAALLGLCGLMAAAANPVDKAARLVFRNSGFSIAPLDEAGPGSGQVLMMFLPATGGFAANVNVQKQPYAGTLEEYAALSKKQAGDAALKIISDKIDQGALRLEYCGTMQGRSLHWYALATLKAGTIYLATATATEEQWPDVSARLKACVDSLVLEPGGTPAPAAGNK